MAQEIERKFLVLNDGYKSEAFKSTRIIQGYLSSSPERTVRVRLKGNTGYITIKGKVNNSGLSRFEWEKEIGEEDAIDLLKICEPGTIEKIRYEINCGNHIFEVDEFQGVNEGLVVAEIELSHEDETFSKPDWIGVEVTGDNRYYNSMLSKMPYSNWDKT